MATTIIHVPHASTEIPASERRAIVLSDAELSDELVRMTDWYTDELFDLPEKRAESIRFPVSRLVLDPERFVDDQNEPMAARGMGAIYTRTSTGHTLRQELTLAERQRLLGLYYWPHHEKLECAIASALCEQGFCLIIDAHSFSSTPLPHETDQHPGRPDICVGTDEFHTPAGLLERAISDIRSQGFSVAVNRPFSGSLVPGKFYKKDRRVGSIMLEINRTLYLDEHTGCKQLCFDEFCRRWKRVVAQIIDGATSSISHPP
jgi:N-formylglutamate amidohydrolase